MSAKTITLRRKVSPFGYDLEPAPAVVGSQVEVFCSAQANWNGVIKRIGSKSCTVHCTDKVYDLDHQEGRGQYSDGEHWIVPFADLYVSDSK